MNVEISHQKKFGKVPNTWRLKNILLKNEWTNQADKEEIKKYMEVNENDNTTTQNLWDAAKAVLRGKYIAIQVTDTQPNLTPERVGQRTANKTQNSRRQEIVKIRAD